MFCSLDKIDLAANVKGRLVAVQTDHRTPGEVVAAPELSALFAMTRVINARAHLAEEGTPDADVRYVMPGDAPPILRDALAATGAVLDRAGVLEPLGPSSEDSASELADRCFAALARKAAAHVGVRDLGMALRMLEDQTLAAPPVRDEDEDGYWTRVLELAALVGELLRAKHPKIGRWIQSDRAMIPFGFRIATGEGATIMFPTNRAQRLVEDGRDESLFKLLVAADEALEHPPDATTGRLMPSLRGRDSVDLDEVLWRPLVPEEERRTQLPIVICGVDGESTFGMIRRDALDRPEDDAMAEALANLAAERVYQEELHAGGMMILVVAGSFYAAEKVLDVPFMRTLHADLGASQLAVATPARGMMLVTAGDPVFFARFAALAKMRHDDAGARAISPAILLVTGGEITGYVRETAELPERLETAGIRAETTPETPPKRPGFLRRLFGRGKS